MAAPPVPVRRAEVPADAEFLAALYAAHRAADFAALGLPAAALAVLLGAQAAAQATYYRAAWPQARGEIVLDAGGAPAGRLLVAYGAGELRLVDIALLPRHCGKGLGTALLRTLIDEASIAGLPLGAHVARDNRARRLYARLGFVECDDGGPYLALSLAAAHR